MVVRKARIARVGKLLRMVEHASRDIWAPSSQSDSVGSRESPRTLQGWKESCAGVHLVWSLTAWGMSEVPAKLGATGVQRVAAKTWGKSFTESTTPNTPLA